jgi:hypothetical protein
MRRRRADQCLLRAAAALDAEFPEAAEKVLNEARELCPAHPELEDVAARLLEASEPAHTRAHPGALSWVVLLLAWLLALVVLLR